MLLLFQSIKGRVPKARNNFSLLVPTVFKLPDEMLTGCLESNDIGNPSHPRLEVQAHIECYDWEREEETMQYRYRMTDSEDTNENQLSNSYSKHDSKRCRGREEVEVVRR